MTPHVRLWLACALWSVPAAAFACDGTASPSYAGITQIFFSSEGLTQPVSVLPNVPLVPGDCPADRNAWIWPQGAWMGGDHCYRSRSGEPTGCCPGTFDTDDSPAQIFARLLAVLERDRFYDVASAQSLAPAQSGAVLVIAVLRCAPRPDLSVILAALRKPNPQSTVLRIVIPFNTKPGNVPGVAHLLDDVTRAVYQSNWYGQDIY